MFVVTLTYVKSLDVVDGLLAEHIRYLQGNYARGLFVLSGPQQPRVGGLIDRREIPRRSGG